jgi:D-alanine-D-alanine ligase
VNPLAGLHPEHSDLPILSNMVGLPYRELLGQIVDSAAERMPQRESLPRVAGGRR